MTNTLPAQHSPIPWTASNDRRGVWEIIANGQMLAQVWSVGTPDDLPAEANAEFIARAVNCHDDLLAACKQQLAALDGPPGDFTAMLAAHRALEAAVTKAEGKSA